MTDHSAPASARRVLALVLSPRFSGRAVVDDIVHAPVAFESWDLRGYLTLEEKCKEVVSRVLRAVATERPSIAVLGVPLADSDTCRALREHVGGALRQKDVPVVTRAVATARCFLLGRLRSARPDGLAAHIVATFFPKLAAERGKTGNTIRYRRNAWSALALALQEATLLGSVVPPQDLSGAAATTTPWMSSRP